MIDYIGQQFGNYQILRLLGRGSFAEVYLAEHLYLEVPAAIKVLHVEMDPGTYEQFRREAHTIAHLQHPHIVRILDFGVRDYTPFLIMEYTSTDTLRSLHPRGVCLSLELIANYVKQIASALDYAHAHHVIHCDVKPDNMLLNTRQEVVLSDFGIAVVQQSLSSSVGQNQGGRHCIWRLSRFRANRVLPAISMLLGYWCMNGFVERLLLAVLLIQYGVSICINSPLAYVRNASCYRGL